MLSKTNKTMGMNDMKDLNEYAEQRSIKDPTFKKELDQQRINFSAAALVRDLRKSTGLSQREFAKRVGKPQSTTAKLSEDGEKPVRKKKDKSKSSSNSYTKKTGKKSSAKSESKEKPKKKVKKKKSNAKAKSE